MQRREPRLTLIELGLILGSVAVLPFGGPLGFGCALGGSAVVAKAIRRSRRGLPTPYDPEQRLRDLRQRRLADAYLLAEIDGHVLIEVLDHVRYRAVPRPTLSDSASVIATLCLRGSPAQVERQLLPWRRVPHPLFSGFVGMGVVRETSIVLFQPVEGPNLDEVEVLPRDEVRRLAGALFEAMQACEEQGIILDSLPASRLKLNGPTFSFAWKEPFDGRRCVSDPLVGWEWPAPEQVLTHPVSPKTCQFFLGLLLYRALLGRHPFGEGNAVATLMATLQAETPPMPDLPEDLQAFLRRLLAKDPELRYSSLAEAHAAGLSVL